MHDDQHGTAIVILAGLLNALKVVGKRLGSVKIVVSGAGAAGTAIAKLITLDGAKSIIIVDREGIIHKDRPGLAESKLALALMTNPHGETGNLVDALKGADVFIGVSSAGLVSADMVRTMAEDPIVFALANPVPEILPNEAYKGGARVVATGRSDFPNQLNNALVFPGVFRGALDNDVTHITDDMKLRAARAIAKLIPKPTAKKIVPDIFDKRIVPAVAKAIR
jgi:malate dehydrogenase (oxaloacetate-decarboxylating)